MTEQEVHKVLAILMTADNNCSVCSRRLAEKFAMDFPEYEELARAILRAIYEEEFLEGWKS